MNFQAISGPAVGGVVRGMLELGDERPEPDWECGLGLSDWKAWPGSSSPRPLLAQPSEEQETLCTRGSLPSDPWAP